MRSPALDRAREPLASGTGNQAAPGRDGSAAGGDTVTAARAARPAASLIRAGVIAAIVLIADRITKTLVSNGIAVGAVRHVIPGVQLVHVQNTGVAFSLFAGGGALVLVLTLVALGALIAYFLRRPTRPWLWLPTGLLVGGAVGNLIDRLANGSVTDFIKLPHWPAFNVSDIAITVGVIVLVLVLEGLPARRRGQ
ncbi:MAG: signal peptidase II [Solirubrobacteraceae bacterium]